MATAKQKAWRAKFARLYGRKKKKRTAPKRTRRSASPKKARPMARRTRRTTKRRGGHKKYVSLSLLNVGQLAMQYANLTGKPLGAILDQLVGVILGGQGDIFEILMAEMLSAVKNVTDYPFQVAAKGAVIAGFFAIIRSFAGRKKIIGLGKFRITV